MEGAESIPPKRERAPQMSIQRGKDHYIKVRLYPTPDIDDPRPFIAKDLKGREVKLTPEQEESAKPYVFPKR